MRWATRHLLARGVRDARRKSRSLPIAEADLGIPWNWRIGPASRPVSKETYVAQAFTPEGRSGCGRFSVVHVEQPWRTPRAPGDSPQSAGHAGRALSRPTAGGGLEVPLARGISKPTRWEILDGATVKRVAERGPPPAPFYTSAQQTADWGGPLGPVRHARYPNLPALRPRRAGRSQDRHAELLRRPCAMSSGGPPCALRRRLGTCAPRTKTGLLPQLCQSDGRGLRAQHASLRPSMPASRPSRTTGDGSDVIVEDAAGRRIPWSEVSRINDDEMRALDARDRGPALHLPSADRRSGIPSRDRSLGRDDREVGTRRSPTRFCRPFRQRRPSAGSPPPLNPAPLFAACHAGGVLRSGDRPCPMPRPISCCPTSWRAQAQKHVTHNEALRILDGLGSSSPSSTGI